MDPPKEPAARPTSWAMLVALALVELATAALVALAVLVMVALVVPATVPARAAVPTVMAGAKVAAMAAGRIPTGTRDCRPRQPKVTARACATG